MPAITLIYTSTRTEVWQWYWQAWRKKLWMYHASYFMCILAIAVSLDGHWPPRSGSVLYGLLTAAAVIIFFILFPQLMFKPHERTLIVGEGGIDTRIGRKSGTVTWEKVAAIQDTPDLTTIVGKNGNAFLIPNRAFNSEKDRREFLASVKHWQLRSVNPN